MRAVLAALALLVLAAGPALAQSEMIPRQTAVLQGLDKITARISTFEAPIGETVTFGSLDIVARTCRETPPEEPPESAAFLEIIDQRPDGPALEVFSGWMFASSPAVSAMEHPVYDVWVVSCQKEGAKNAEGEAAEQAAGEQEADTERAVE